MFNFIKLTATTISILSFCLFVNTSAIKAQCPTGETEVTISFDTSETYNYYTDQLQNALWNYVVQSVASDAGPFSLLDTITVCVPDGDLTITGCGDFFAWVATPIKAVITEDGSVNGCSDQNGCELLYDPYSWYFYSPNECDDLPTTPIITFPVGCNSSEVFTMGCTNPDAPNYNPCAVEDNGTCQLENPNSFCENALPIDFDGCEEQNMLVNIESNSFSGLLPSCISNNNVNPDTIPAVDIFYELVVPQSGNIKIEHYASDGIAIYNSCMGNEIYCENGFNNTIIIDGLPAGETVILQFWKFSAENFELCLEALPGSASNDLCENAINLCGQIANGTTADAFPQDNDPELTCASNYNPNSVWYSFTTNDSNEPVSIFIEPTLCELYFYFYDDFKDGLNAGIYQGTCDNFTLQDCTTFISPNTNNYILEIQDPLPNETYYVYVASKDYALYCDFNVTTSTGINNCCELDISLNTVCESTDTEGYYIDIEIDDFGSNTSGFIVNNGDFQNITSAGITQIGPFSNHVTAVTLQGIDDAECVLTYKVSENCNIVTNNDCSNPLPVNIETDNICSDVDYIQVDDPGSFSGLVPNCNNDYTIYNIIDDLFYQFVVPNSGSIKINIENANVALYSSCDLQSIACSERNYQYWFDNLTPGDTLIVQFWRDQPTPYYSFCIEEIPLPPNEDFCENAVTLCGALVNAETGTSTRSDTDPIHSCEDQYSYDNNIWYTFTSDESGLPITINIIDSCNNSNYATYADGFIASFYEGNCTELTEIDCFSLYGYENYQAGDIHQLEVATPNPNTTYYLMLSAAYGADCSFEIFTSTGIENCCNANYTVTPICEEGEEDQFYVEIEMNDLGDNPSGYSINEGEFPNITSTGLVIAGPYIEDVTITLTGLDTGCELYHPVFTNCTVAPLNSTCENAEPYDLKPFGSCFHAFNYYWEVYDANNASLSVQPSCISDNQAANSYNLFYEVVVPSSGIIHFFSFEGNLAVYDACSGNELFCVYDTRDGYTLGDLTPGDTLIFQILSLSEQVDFCIQEQPNTPVNDLCESAIPLCEGTFTGHNINATTSNSDAFSACNTPQNTIWYSFKAQSDEPVSFELYAGYCINYFGGSYGDMVFSIFSGECGGPYVEEFCENFQVFDIENFEFENPVAGQQYLIEISGEDDLQCSFDIIIEEGVKPCCGPDILLTPSCPGEAEQDVFYIDIEVTDLGENPSGYTVNDGEFPNITTTGVTTIGPFNNGDYTVTLDGIDVVNCVIQQTITQYCNCSEVDISDSSFDELVFTGDSITLNERRPSPGIGCETIWVTDIDNPNETIIGTGAALTFIPGVSTTVYGLTNCDNCVAHHRAYNITLLDFAQCNNLAVAGSTGTVLFYGNYYDYYFATELSIELTDTVACEFLYWVTDLDDPEGSIISTEQNYTVETPAGSAVNYYGIVSCGDSECVETVTVFTPIFDFYPYYPYPCPNCEPGDYEPVDPDDPDGQQGSDGEDDQNATPCPDVSAGEISIASRQICSANQPELRITGEQLATGKNLYYVFHNNPGLSTDGYSEATSIYGLSYENQASPVSSLPCASTIYVTAFVSDAVAELRNIDLTEQCVTFSNTVDFTYLCAPEINVIEQCNNNGTYDLAVSITGGLPQVDNSASYSVFGSVYSGNVYENQTFTIAALADGSNFNIEVADNANCGARVTGSFQCDKLPVELLFFNGEAVKEGNLLKWVTATEINNDYFTIEGSTNGINFTKLGTVKGTGNSNETETYQFLDRQAVNGVSYYRLSQTDFNGTTTMKATTEVRRGESSNITLIQAYPVPFLDELNIQLHNILENEVKISLIDLIGKEVISKKFTLQQGFNEIALSTVSLSKGLYLITIEDKEGVYYQKVTKN